MTKRRIGAKTLVPTAIVAAVGVALALTAAGCSGGQRALKSIGSDLSGGLNRELVVYSATGEELFSQTGRFDIGWEDDHIVYDDADGLRHTIYLGGGTAIANEIPEGK